MDIDNLVRFLTLPGMTTERLLVLHNRLHDGAMALLDREAHILEQLISRMPGQNNVSGGWR